MTRDDLRLAMTRRQFFRRSTGGVAIGIPALAGLLAQDGYAAPEPRDPKTGALVGFPNFPPKAKRVIFLHQSGAPSQIELFDPKMTAPSEIRSMTGEVTTRLPGVTFGGTFPRLAPNFIASFMISGEVVIVSTTSTSFISGTGLKKCIPINRSTRFVAVIISVITNEDVLLAKIAGGLTILSIVA